MKLRYTIEGQGEKIVLIHGWAKNASIKSLQNLQKELAVLGYQAINLELPGFGESPQAPSDWGIAEFSQYVTDQIRKLIGNDNYYLFGHSFGGSITAYISALLTSKPNKIILCSSAGLRYRSLKAKLLFPVAKVLKLPLKILPENLAQNLRKNIYYYIIRERDYIDSQAKQAQFQKVVNQDLTEEFKKINIPTLIIWGKDDKITPVSMAKQLNSLIPGSELKIIQGRHGIPLTSPQKVAQLINDFIKEGATRP